MTRRILVTDGEQRAALAVVRSLGAAGHQVFVAAESSRPLAAASRYARSGHVVPSPLEHPGQFVDALLDLCRRHGITDLWPIAEASLLAVLPERERFAGVQIPFAAAERFRAISDKAEVLAAAEAVGIRIPRQVRLDAPASPPAGVRFPVVLKPSRSVSGGEGRRVKTAVRYAADGTAWTKALAAFPAEAFPVLAQERIVGPGIGIFLLLWDGRTRAVFAHRRIREKPPSGGVSVFRESVPAPQELVERSRALLERFSWQGVGMVEYKVDAATGEPYLMEVNGRFWGSLQLAIDAGVDFPRLLLAASMGEPAGAPPACRPGVRSRWFWGDVDHLLARWRRSGEALALPPGAPGRLRTLGHFLGTFVTPGREEIFRPSDPGPFWRESVNWIQGR